MTIAPQPFTDADDLPQPREPVAHVRLKFSGDATGDEHPIHDLSACAGVDNTLFVAGDEANGIERLHLRGDGTLAHHTRFPLCDFVKLRDPEEEMDIEGLAYADGWLWVTGSHSRTRPDPRHDGMVPDVIDVNAFADLKDTRPRCVLARIPVIHDDDGLPRPVKKDGDRRAGLVKQKKKHGSKLARYLSKNPLLAPSTAMAAKEGGLDVEGIAVSGERVVLGLRGPVMQTFAVLVEPVIEPKKKGKLHLPGKPLLRLVDLNGLGVRDLLVKGDDLWILAGPTGDLDGRCAIFVWIDWGKDAPSGEDTVKLHRPLRLFDIPIKLNADHPEGIAFWTDDAGQERLLVVYDTPNVARVDEAEGTILADLFATD